MVKLKKIISKLNIIVLLVLAVSGATLIFTQYFGLFPLTNDYALDMRNYYSGVDFFNSLNQMDALSRKSYLMIHIADYFFMLGFYPLLSKIIYKYSHKLKWLFIIPIFSLIFDFLENIIFDMHLVFYPVKENIFGSIAGISTSLKFITLYAAFILIIFLVINNLFTKKTN